MINFLTIQNVQINLSKSYSYYSMISIDTANVWEPRNLYKSSVGLVRLVANLVMLVVLRILNWS